MALKRQQSVIAQHSAAVIGDPDQPPSAGLNLHAHVGGAGIQRILQQLLYDGRRALHHFTGGDLVGNLIGENTDAAHLQSTITRVYAGDVVIVDLVQIRERADLNHAQNLAFCRWVHDHRHPIEEFQHIAVEVQRHIDCTACANCCRETVVAVDDREVAAIARHLNVEPDLAACQYTRPDPEDSSRRVLKQEHGGCIFLNENLCMIYDARPKACCDFPHVAEHSHSLGARLSSLCRRTAICPIVFNAFEAYKQRLGFR